MRTKSLSLYSSTIVLTLSRMALRWASSPYHTGTRPMTLDVVVIQQLVALVAGILILLVPRLLNYVVAI